MDPEFDLIGRYRAVSSKLKKRFLRKPNVAEAGEQFGSLCKALKQQDCPEYAGFCCLAMARCENALSNPVGETEGLVEAARLFIEAEQENITLKCPAFDEHLTEAIHCLNQAIKVHCNLGNNALAAKLCLELATTLRMLKHSSEAVGHYLKAAELQHQTPLAALWSMSMAAKCKVDLGDYDGSLSLLTEMTYLAQESGGLDDQTKDGTNLQGPFVEILSECEVTRVLLLMLLQPTPQRIRPEHAQTLEKYAWESKNKQVQYLSEDLFLLMQSMVMACQSRDLEDLRSLEIDLWPYLKTDQRHLMHLIIQSLSNSV